MRRHHLHLIVLASSAVLLAIMFFQLTETLKERLYLEAAAIRHTHPRLGYTLTTPSSWTFDPSRTFMPVDVIRHKSGGAMIFIETLEDPAFASEAGIFAMERKIKNDFAAAKNRYSLRSFETITWKKHAAFRMKGVRKNETETWSFIQYVVFLSGTKRAYNITANLSETFAAELEKGVEDIIASINLPSLPPENNPNLLR